MNELLTFSPVFVHVLWGGDRIARFKGIPPQGDDIGESWELSPMPGRESVADSGPLKGRTLTAIMAEYGHDIMGRRLMKKFNGQFPLLVKFIDSRRDLSIQVHPDDEMAARVEGKRGKAEMWYCIAPEDGAYLYRGFSKPESPDDFRRHVDGSTITGLLCKHFTHPGDVFYIPAGCVHAIGSGNFVVEIQEASDVTYRIFDYNRPGTDGKPRELHVDKAIEAVKFDAGSQHAPFNAQALPGSETPMVHSPYFNTDLLEVDGTTAINLATRDSFTILIAVNGEVTVNTPAGSSLTLRQGRTMLIPATVPAVTISGRSRLISVYVP